MPEYAVMPRAPDEPVNPDPVEAAKRTAAAGYQRFMSGGLMGGTFSPVIQTSGGGVPGSGSGGGTGISGTGGTGAGVPDNLKQITDMINKLNMDWQAKFNANRIPNATGLETQSSANIGSQLRGEIPADVLRLLAQQGAERGVAGGMGGSPNETSGYLRALGLTSLDLQDKGQANLSSALARNPGAQAYDPSGLITTPYQQSQLALQNQQLELDRQRLAQEAAMNAERIRTSQLARAPVRTAATSNYMADDTLQNIYKYGHF